MQYVVLDTNAWINLANGTEPSKLLLALHRGVLEGEIVVVLPTLIIDEWKKGKHKLFSGGILKVFDELDKGFGLLLKSINKDSSFLSPQADVLAFEETNEINHWEYFKNIASDFKFGRKEIENLIKGNSEIIEEIFGHYSTIAVS